MIQIETALFAGFVFFWIILSRYGGLSPGAWGEGHAVGINSKKYVGVCEMLLVCGMRLVCGMWRECLMIVLHIMTSHDYSSLMEGESH